jgi:hypothetical protein
VRSGDWRLVEFYDDMRVELYNLADDLGESKNLADSHPEQTARLRTMLHDWRRSVGAQMPVSNPNHDPVQDAQDKAAQQSRPQPRTKK